MDNLSKHTTDWFSGLSKDPGFDVPKGYFDQVEDDFSIKLKEESFPKESGFKVPSNYFDTLEDKILDQVEFPKKRKVISFQSRITKIGSIAAAIALLFVSYIYIANLSNNEPTFDEIAMWVDTNINDIDAEDIMSVLEDDESLDDTFLSSSVEEGTIDKYLDENDTYILIEESQGLFDEIN